MISDVEGGKISTVIVKDMSRFGRDYIMVGYYTEIYFSHCNVRFVTVNDGVDSNSPFGYMKDTNDNDKDKDKWIIDEEAAQIVKRIFRIFLDGMNMPQIARQLITEKVGTPQLYYLRREICRTRTSLSRHTFRIP